MAIPTRLVGDLTEADVVHLDLSSRARACAYCTFFGVLFGFLYCFAFADLVLHPLYSGWLVRSSLKKKVCVCVYIGVRKRHR